MIRRITRLVTIGLIFWSINALAAVVLGKTTHAVAMRGIYREGSLLKGLFL
jgi:hypothetical protein